MNRVMLIGRLTAKPELRYTATNTPYSRFTLAVNRTFSNNQGQREADFINIVVWRKQAENVCNFLDKGSMVSVEGRIQTGSFEDKDGNKRYTMDVVGDAVQFLESKGARNHSSGGTTTNTNTSPYDYQDTPAYNDVSVENDPFAEFGDSVSIDDNFLD